MKCLEKDNIPRAIHKAALHMQAELKKDDDEASQLDKSSKKTGWSGMQVCLMDKKKDISSKMKDDIILDNGSTLSIFANPELVEGIRKSKSTLEMATNAGMRLINQEANVPGFGTIWYDEGAIANIFSFAELVDKHRITFDSSVENTFLVINQTRSSNLNAHQKDCIHTELTRTLPHGEGKQPFSDDTK